MDRPLEMCICCYEPTGNAGKDEDSLYIIDSLGREFGPFCQECYDEE